MEGEFLWGSNYTFLVRLGNSENSFQAVYKPNEGERPLWDFPSATLAHREAAAYLVSEALRWDLVPPTVYRMDGPYGPGSLQLFIQHDPEYHYFNLEKGDINLLRPVVLFDLLINNADRKGSHIIFDEDHHLWLIDHGVSFHVEDKLRTVIWDFSGETIPGNLLSDIAVLIEQLESASSLHQKLTEHISTAELHALIARAKDIQRRKAFPSHDRRQRPFPWPPL